MLMRCYINTKYMCFMASFLIVVMFNDIRATLVNFLYIVVTISGTIFLIFKWKYQHWKRRNIPYLEPKIPFGNIGNVFYVPRDENITEIYKEAKSKGWKYCGLFMLLSPAMLIVDMELVKRVLAKDFQYFVDRGTYVNEKKDPLGAHLFALPGQKWKRLRAKLTPAFSSGKLKGMFQTLADCGIGLEEYLEGNVKHTMDIKSICDRFSMDVLGSCAFGLDCNSFKETDSSFIKSVQENFARSKWDTFLWLFMDNFPEVSRILGIRQVRKKISDFFTDVVPKIVTYREKNNYVRKDLMQLLIDMKNDKSENEDEDGGSSNLTMTEIIAQTYLFFVAGSDTSATTLTFVIFELATHPEIQERLRDEIATVLARYNNKITYDALQEMTYMGQIIDETLRLYAPARVVDRICGSDYKIPGEDVVLEEGTRVIVSIKGIHFDEEYWPNPEVFDPDRFGEENRKNLVPFAHLPFGQGPKACIAERFGRMEVKVGVTSILRKFRVKLNKRTKLPLDMSVECMLPSVEGGIWIDFEKV